MRQREVHKGEKRIDGVGVFEVTDVFNPRLTDFGIQLRESYGSRTVFSKLITKQGTYKTSSVIECCRKYDDTKIEVDKYIEESEAFLLELYESEKI